MKIRALLSRSAFVLWLFALSVVVAALMARHLIALPSPARDDRRVQAGLASLRLPGEEGRFLVVHVMYSECRCSLRIIEHLTQTPRPPGLVEKVLLVGPPGELSARLARAGFGVELVTPRDLRETFQIEAAPLFLVVGPGGEVRYAGGYTTEKQGPDIRDLDIIAGVMSAQEREALPVLGCAVSEQLQQELNPVGLP